MSKVDLCHCGKPLHYKSKEAERVVRMLVSQFGPTIVVTIAGKGTWIIQRHYIALHGIKAKEIDTLGFEKVV